MYHCTEEEGIYAANHHLLIFCAKKKSSADWVDGLVNGWMDGVASLRINYTNQKPDMIEL